MEAGKLQYYYILYWYYSSALTQAIAAIAAIAEKS